MSILLQIGVSEENEGYKNQAITTSNFIFVLGLLMGIVAVVVSHKFMPDLVFLAYVFLVGIIASLALNAMGLADVGRFFFILVNALVLSLLNALPLEAGEALYPHLYLAQLSIAVLPWIIIDVREGGFIYLTTAVALLFFIFQPFIVESFTIEIDRGFLESGMMVHLIYGFSLVNVVASLYVLSRRHAWNEKGGQKMVDEISAKSNAMEAQQLEIQAKIEELSDSHKEEEDRSWVSKQLTQIADIIRNSKSENIFAELAEEMVKCLDANQLAIFLLNEEENTPFLEIKGCYAIDRVKQINERYSTEKGTIGQCFKDREFLYIDNLPKSHLRFTSGQGEEPPKYLALIPLIENNNISGILEVISHHPFGEKEKNFFKQVSELVASYILSNTMSVKIKMLIEQNQVQAEEMKAQEEEMLQNMEELQATQEEMSRKEKEYLQEINNLEAEIEIRNSK